MSAAFTECGVLSAFANCIGIDPAALTLLARSLLNGKAKTGSLAIVFAIGSVFNIYFRYYEHRRKDILDFCKLVIVITGGNNKVSLQR